MLSLDQNGIWVSHDRVQISYPDSGNDACRQVEDRSFWFNHRNDVLSQVIKKFPFQAGFLDIGGGNGYQLSCVKKKYPATECILAEPGYAGCLNARKRGLEQIFCVPFQQFDFKKHLIGGVGLFDVLEHIEDDVGFLRDLKSRLPAGTLIYFTVPAYQWLWSDADEAAGHFRRHTKASIRRLAENAGVELLESKYFFSYLVPALLLTRVLPYQLGFARNSEQVNQEESQRHLIGRSLQMVLRILNALDLKLPFGGSLVGVMRVLP